ATNFSLANVITDESCDYNDGTVVINPMLGVGPFTYTWSTGASANSINNLTAGSYPVTITDSRGCYQNYAANIQFVPGPANYLINAFSMQETCEDANGAINLTPTGGTGPYTYSWSNGTSNSIATGLAAGTYQVTVTDVNGCYVEETINVNGIPLSPAPVITMVNDSLYSSTGVTYQWNFNSSPITGANTNVYPANQTGIYSVTITDSLGCELTSDTISVLLTGIDDNGFNSNVSIWPNPASDYLQYELNMGQNHEVAIVIENILGQKLFYDELGNISSISQNVQVANYENGIYFITFIIDNEKFTKKFIKN
ncbi:MAG: T9SS type A sorting domain-containing protein, partial [Bacteroidia bacterium]|nr:T9SS type A sorting domain-containing protein [Bacteroidia bacterium]